MSEQLLLDRGPAPLPPTVTCFSLHQPYAGLVAAWLKDETRTFPWPEKARPYPAPLLICASQTSDAQATVRVVARLLNMGDTATGLLFGWRGVALAVVDVVGCRPLVEADLPRSWYWDPEDDKRRGKTRWLWQIANVRRVRPFAVNGRQGFAQKVPREQAEQALAEWGSTTTASVSR